MKGRGLTHGKFKHRSWRTKVHPAFLDFAPVYAEVVKAVNAPEPDRARLIENARTAAREKLEEIRLRYPD